MSGDAIYERQRSLIRAKVLKPGAGRGPGSGVVASPENVALLLLAVLAAESPNEGANRVKRLAKLEYAKSPAEKRCIFSGKNRLIEALTFLLTPRGKCDDLPVLVVSGNRNIAALRETMPLRFGGGERCSFFGISENYEGLPNIERSAAFDLTDLHHIFEDRQI